MAQAPHDMNYISYQMKEDEVLMKKRKCLLLTSILNSLKYKLLICIESSRALFDDTEFNVNISSIYNNTMSNDQSKEDFIYGESIEHIDKDMSEPIPNDETSTSSQDDEYKAKHNLEKALKKRIQTKSSRLNSPLELSSNGDIYRLEMKLDQLFKQNEELFKVQSELKSLSNEEIKLMLNVQTELKAYHELVQQLKELQADNSQLREEIDSIKRLLSSSSMKTSMSSVPMTIRSGITYKPISSVKTTSSSMKTGNTNSRLKSSVSTVTNRIKTYSSTSKPSFNRSDINYLSSMKTRKPSQPTFKP